MGESEIRKEWHIPTEPFQGDGFGISKWKVEPYGKRDPSSWYLVGEIARPEHPDLEIRIFHDWKLPIVDHFNKDFKNKELFMDLIKKTLSSEEIAKIDREMAEKKPIYSAEVSFPVPDTLDSYDIFLGPTEEYDEARRPKK